MPISATGTDRCAGFSLVELLVVVFIIGLLSGVAVLSLPGEGATPRETAERLAARLRMAAAEAITSGQAMGAAIDARRYRFYRREAGTWQRVEKSRIFAGREWPADVTVMAESGDRDLMKSQESETPVPEIRFAPTGIGIPFTVTLSRDGRRMIVTGTATGEISLETPDA